jgi:hypothetical protein
MTRLVDYADHDPRLSSSIQDSPVFALQHRAQVYLPLPIQTAAGL